MSVLHSAERGNLRNKITREFAELSALRKTKRRSFEIY